MPLFDYVCSKGHTFEALVSHDTDKLPCRTKRCRRTAERVYTYRCRKPRNLASSQHTGRKIWMGSEAFKNYGSPEWQDSTEAAMVRE